MLNFFLYLIVLFSISIQAQTLTSSTNINITKTWEQQNSGYTYPISISVPNGLEPNGGFPVCVLLHGNGSSNPNLAGPNMIKQFQSILSCHILVAPTGYKNSWNICSESSDAPDVEMIQDLVLKLQEYKNVNPNKIRILGTSNGSGLANRIFIENNNPGIDIICAVVSPLNEPQYHSGNFYKPSGLTNPNNSHCGYDVVTYPLISRKYLNISNVNDNLIPYNGGSSVVGVSFLAAETAIYNIAKYKGYSGNILSTGTTSGNPEITKFSYNSGDVVHIKGDAMHSTNNTQKNYIKEYFADCEAVMSNNKIDTFKAQIYPNPTFNELNLEVNSSFIGTEYTLNDQLGRTVLSGKVDNEKTKIDLSKLLNGIYFLSFEKGLAQPIKIAKK